MTPPPELVVVMPVYNEAAGLRRTVLEWRAALAITTSSFRLIAVDDGSTDGSPGILEALGREWPGQIETVSQPNGGHGAACRMGYEHALGSGAPWILQVDADGQCDPGFFGRFWGLRHGVDCVFGRRVVREDSPARALVTRLASLVIGWRAGVRAVDVNVPYRLMRAGVLAEALVRIPHDFALQNVALTVMLLRCTGTRWAWVPIRFRRRAGGGGLRLGTILRLGWDVWRDLARLQA